jgi:hypothetical protein
MQILSHRGLWKEESEKNQKVAFRRSFELGFGTETDLRDLAGEIVISHDPPLGGELTLESFFQLYCEHSENLTLALNIKSDGLQPGLKSLINRYSITNYFVFDMSVPDARQWINFGMRFFTRESEFEPVPYFQQQAAGVWLDCFLNNWICEKVIGKYLQQGKQVCLVSPDLHKREYHDFWKYLQSVNVIQDKNLMLCTDHPEEASSFFSY